MLSPDTELVSDRGQREPQSVCAQVDAGYLCVCVSEHPDTAGPDGGVENSCFTASQKNTKVFVFTVTSKLPLRCVGSGMRALCIYEHKTRVSVIDPVLGRARGGVG